MKRTSDHLAGILFLLLCSSPAIPQSARFDVDRYREYLRTHDGVALSSILSEYPAPVFTTRVPSGHTPAYLDSVIAKYGLTQDEQDLLLTNGFVVTERLQASSICGAYFDIWEKDLPVLITTDAILHAVHSAYDMILREQEEYTLYDRLRDLLTKLRTKGLPVLHARYGSDVRMLPMLRDIDVYFTVAAFLLTGWSKPYDVENAASVDEILAFIDSRQPAATALFCWTPREYDFSQFEPRGHYTESFALQRYFQAMMWLGRTEFMLTAPKSDAPAQFTGEDIRRQTIDALLITEALAVDSAFAVLNEVERFLRGFIGEPDNVTVEHLEWLRSDLGIVSADQLLDDIVYDRWRSALVSQSWASQRINSQILVSDPMQLEQVQPPAAFLLLGQRFLIDSYIMGNVVYDRIMDEGRKVPRMLPSSLDVLFALGNNASAQLLADEISRYRYGRNLSGLRYLVDSYPDRFWEESVYNLWLNGIRSLNPPAEVENLPAFMRTAAWWQEKMNTQLASWAQLRHDNLLYGKSSYSMMGSCSYPYGYVEPIPAFYRAMRRFGEVSAAFMTTRTGENGSAARYFSDFAKTMDTLTRIAEKELRDEPFSAGENDFIGRFLFARNGCVPVLDGWYLRLCYREEAVKPVIADVHTAPSDERGGDVGWVLHAGTTENNIGFVIAPSGEGTASVYAGAMLGYSEYITTNFRRLTDEEWGLRIWLDRQWSRPDWTNLYLADTAGRKRSPAPSLFTADAPRSITPSVANDAPVITQTYPNPVLRGAGMLIQFSLPAESSSAVRLTVTDVLGREIATLLDRPMQKGVYMTRWDGRTPEGETVAPGMYLVRCTGASGMATRKIVVE